MNVSRCEHSRTKLLCSFPILTGIHKKLIKFQHFGKLDDRVVLERHHHPMYLEGDFKKRCIATVSQQAQ